MADTVPVLATVEATVYDATRDTCVAVYCVGELGDIAIEMWESNEREEHGYQVILPAATLRAVLSGLEAYKAAIKAAQPGE